MKTPNSEIYSKYTICNFLLTINSNFWMKLTPQKLEGYAYCMVKMCTPNFNRFYRAMHFSAKRGIAIACRLSVRPSVCLSVCL